MEKSIELRSGILIAAIAAAVFVPVLLAGPPLVCHPFNIGGARSLPWSSSIKEAGWNAPRSDYDISRLPEETIALLTPDTPVIVRMETMRRAAIYCATDASVAGALLSRLKSRIEGKRSERDALHLFDYGYMIETMKQTSPAKGTQNSPGPAAGMAGYPLIREALQSRPNDPEMEFAAAIVTSWPKLDQHRDHFRKAVMGAGTDPLLANNLVEHFSDRGKTLAELRVYAEGIAQKK